MHFRLSITAEAAGAAAWWDAAQLRGASASLDV
jgi:hypothetical protein